MYLTQLRLDPRSAQARRDLADPYDMHRTLTRAFVENEIQAPPRFLWRVEPGNAWAQPVLLVQSAHSADWSCLQTLPGYLQHGQLPETKSVDVDQLLHSGDRYRFRLLANPTVTREGKRYGLVGEDAQLAWLKRQGERHGFAIEAALVTSSNLAGGRKGQARMSLLCVCFDGVLQLANRDLLSRALEAGIGPGKAFGCGLLSLARAA